MGYNYDFVANIMVNVFNTDLHREWGGYNVGIYRLAGACCFNFKCASV